MDVPATQIPARNTSRLAGRCRAGGPGMAVPTETASTLGTGPGSVPGEVPADGVPSPGAGTAGSADAAAPLGEGLALTVARASGDRPAAGRPAGVPAVDEAGSAADDTFTMTDPTWPPPPSRQPGSIDTLTRPCRNSTATWL